MKTDMPATTPPNGKTYLVTLRPQTDYYFGGENNLGSGENRNYLAHSRTWPQQTSVIGMLRYLLLQEKRLLAKPGERLHPDSADLIGPKSFDLGNGNTDLEQPADFGKILSLSPLFLTYAGTPYFRAPLNLSQPLKQAEKARVWYGGEEKTTSAAYDLESFSAKIGLDNQLVDPVSGNTFSDDAPFRQVSQVGIEKGDQGGTKDQAYYKQTLYTLNKDWSFAFLLTLNSDTPLPGWLEVPFGGENRIFSLEITPAEVNTIEDYWTKPDDKLAESFSRFLLLSDTYLDAQALSLCRFSVIETVDFRFLQTSVANTSAYADLSYKSGKAGARTRSGKYNLLVAGSVLYPLPDKLNELKAQIEKNRLQQIGLNHFITLPNSKNPTV